MQTKPGKHMKVLLSPADVARVEAAVDRAVQVSDELHTVTLEENRRLKSGRPTSIDDLMDRKRALVSELEAFLKSFKEQSNLFLLASPKKFTQLQVSNEKLASALSENSRNLVRALTANRRRVDTIMRAIRDKQSASARYDKTGRYGAKPSQPLSIGRRYEV
ncbi:hypothetical protein WNZ15_07840 [Roseibium sp. AS2]|uniref:hypothetical protein n=1 Tax=Roseibium sp. AS2 TaxID=3135781 RepID=UPI00317C0C1A